MYVRFVYYCKGEECWHINSNVCGWKSNVCWTQEKQMKKWCTHKIVLHFGNVLIIHKSSIVISKISYQSSGLPDLANEGDGLEASLNAKVSLIDLSSWAHLTGHSQSGPFSSFSLRCGYHWWLRCGSMRLVSGGVLWCTRTTNAVILMAVVLLWTRNSSSLTYWEDYWLNFGPMTGQIHLG